MNHAVKQPDLFFEKLGTHHDGNDLSLSKKISTKQLKYIFKVANHSTTISKTKNFIKKISKYFKIFTYKFFIYFEELTKNFKYKDKSLGL